MTGVEVEGAERLTRTLGDLADDIGNLEPANKKAADQLLGDARPPYVSGELGSSGSTEADDLEGVVVYAAEYAGPIHNGWEARNIEPQPWLSEATDPNTLAEVYVEHVADLVRLVKGA